MVRPLPNTAAATQHLTGNPEGTLTCHFPRPALPLRPHLKAFSSLASRLEAEAPAQVLYSSSVTVIEMPHLLTEVIEGSHFHLAHSTI
jgi:hypothetical protein